MAHTWTARIDLFDEADSPGGSRVTTARAVLDTGTTQLEGRGHARRNPEDADVPEIGEELAVARALRALADRLLDVTSEDITAVEHHRVHLRA